MSRLIRSRLARTIACLALVALGIAAAWLWRAPSRAAPPTPSRLVGQPPPAFSLPRIALDRNSSSEPVDSTAYRGRVWMLEVFGAWSGPCRDEHDALLAFARTSTVPIVGLDVAEPPDDGQAWLQERGSPYDAIASDPDSVVSRAWDVRGVPQVFVIDARGVVRAALVGGLDQPGAVQRLRAALAAAQGEAASAPR